VKDEKDLPKYVTLTVGLGLLVAIHVPLHRMHVTDLGYTRESVVTSLCGTIVVMRGKGGVMESRLTMIMITMFDGEISMKSTQEKNKNTEELK
jgi:hypothetical protein